MDTQCCYDQEVTKIFVEGAKVQLGKGWAVGSCDDITIDDLKNISFRACLAGEDPVADTCFPRDSYNQLNEALRRSSSVELGADTLVNQAINSIADTHGPWE